MREMGNAHGAQQLLSSLPLTFQRLDKVVEGMFGQEGRFKSTNHRSALGKPLPWINDVFQSMEMGEIWARN